MAYFPAFSLLMILSSITIGDCIPYRFDYIYNHKASGWLKLHKVPATWNNARLICHAEGAVLLSPIDKNILSEMKKLMAVQKVACGVFIGIHASFAKGIYTSLQGISLAKMPISWAPDEPDNFENSEDCLMMLPNGTLADVKCGDVFPFICYREKSKKGVITGCGTIDNQYALDSRTGSCYKFHVVGQTWSDAFLTCASEGGYLAIINNEREALVLKELFSKYPSNVLFSQYGEHAHLGFLKWNKTGDWFTIYGDTLQEAGYDTWETGQPNNGILKGEGQYCGGINRKARFFDVWCNEVVAFICEKSPYSLLDDKFEDELER